MRKAKIYMHGQLAGHLTETSHLLKYSFEYLPHYEGAPISLTMPTSQKFYEFDRFPPFFDGVLPEGIQLDSLLKLEKLDRDDFFGQLVVLGSDLVGAVTVEEIHE